MKWRDVYRAACRNVVQVETEHGSGSEMYKKAVAGLQEITAMRCSHCTGFGYTNPVAGHVAPRKDNHSTDCTHCYGSGFDPKDGE